MTTRIGGIVVDIDARLAKLEKELARGNRELKKFEQSATASGSRIEAGLVGIGKGVGALVGTLGGLGIALGATELISFGREALAMGDDLATAADQVGIGVERFQTLRQVFRELEVDGDSFDKAMMRLSTTLGDVQSGATNEATKSLDKMGITARILSGEIDTTDELLDAIADSAKRFGTEAEFTAAVVDIFGRRGGVELAAALKNGSGAIKSMEDDVRRLGTVLTEEQINKLADANEVIDKFAQTTSYTFAIWASNVIGSINTVADQWLELQRYLKTGVTLNGAGLAAEARITAISNQTNAARQELANRQRQRQSGAFGWLDSIANSNREAKLKNVIAEGEREITGLINQQRRLASSTPTPTVQTFRGAGGGGGGGGVPRRSVGGGGGVREADSFARTMADLARRTADARMEFTALNEQWDSVTVIDAKMRAEALRIEQQQGTKWTELQRAEYRAATEDLRSLAVQTELAKLAQDQLNDSLAPVEGADMPLVGNLDAELERAAASLPDLRNVWQKTFGDLDDEQRTVFDGLTRNLEGALLRFQSLEDAAESFGKQLLSMALQAFVFAPLGKALKIPGYASGTDFAPGGLAVVGEQGPELVNLPRGAQVMPNNRLRTMNNYRVQSVGFGGGAPVVNQTVNFSGAVDLATRGEVFRIAEATKRSTMDAMNQARRRSSR